MKVFKAILFLSLFLPVASMAQYKSKLTAEQWTDSVLNSLSNEEKIAQLMVVRAHSNLGADHVAKVTNDIKQYNVGALCFFQGGPVRQANLTNLYQSIAKTPLMVTIDGEWGLGMRLDSVTKFPYQLTLGSVSDENLIYRMGLAVGDQCKRIGVHVNYAPVVDINNNPNNPVIGYRSFGEDKYKVSKYGVAYMKGMQDAGIMACAKHFPGHGDVDVDSHYDLPVINKTTKELDSMELVPFRAIFDAGVGSVMIAHLSIPSIDNTKNVATSISKNSVTDLLRNKMGYQGLTFTDALEMKGVAKYFPGGTIAVEALIAGNDMLCLPASVPETIEAVKKAIADKRLTWEDINAKVRKVLMSKYNLGLNQTQFVDTKNLLEDLNAKTDAIRYEVAQGSLTLLTEARFTASRNDYAEIPLTAKQKKIAYVGIGTTELNAFGKRMKDDLDANVFLLSYKDGKEKADEILKEVQKDGKYDAIIIGVHNYSLRPAENFGLSPVALNLYKELNFIKTITLTFGNVLATKNFCDAWTLVACYQDDDITQQAAADLLEGRIKSVGKLPVSVCRFKFGEGIVYGKPKPTKEEMKVKMQVIDSIALDGIAKKAFPGCVILAVHKGDIVYHKAFGNYEYNTSSPAMSPESIFDLASVTKISATTVSVMKLYEEGRLKLDDKLKDYLSWVKGTNKEDLKIDDILLHQAGLIPFIAFYKETIDAGTGNPNPAIYSSKQQKGYGVRVAENIYLRNDWQDTMMYRILKSPLGPKNKYVYSDNDFIFLGKIVEEITGMTLDQYAQKTFYEKIGMYSTGFKPRNRYQLECLVPTETEKHFRQQTTRGDVHDEGASMFGGVAGHAGLFSNAYDLSLLYQMLLNGGELNGVRYLKPETIKFFTAYHSKVSRRGFGFDKPEKDNALRKDPYPSSLASAETFGHTGFTGTCVWVDPKADLVYIFLSNRVYPTRDNGKLSNMGIRGKIQDAIYRAIGI
ncbi:MAG: serine hydrolase [Chitinophagaceae bacterium]|jgi:beta-glucosidase-like glycosyl hydrolase/CubicO group peptidase (beta-lactamase class C family)|nr:serine hydrolase [Chitinophagaceae bacterium]MBK9658587.1 serine hydrolase [Chitinophagaceae bacterium]MBP6232193.1 serine hydrolase [Chitinophagaceae bacterium]MBP6415983.1 serine hydrolase [Chitinophagaceae bacterium]